MYDMKNLAKLKLLDANAREGMKVTQNPKTRQF
jgi:hypothetical protein